MIPAFLCSYFREKKITLHSVLRDVLETETDALSNTFPVFDILTKPK